MLAAPNPAKLQYFGHSVAVHEQWAAVGALEDSFEDDFARAEEREG